MSPSLKGDGVKSILFGAPGARVLLFSLALLALPSIVASADDAALHMERIVITATRTATTILDSPDNVTVITAEELSAAGVATVAEALESVAGVEIADSGTAGSVKSVRIRGSASAQVLVLVDGVRMNDSRQGATDLSLLPAEMIERIEVLRGGTSALYGADALGGVVNIITKNRADRDLTLTLANGSFIPHDAVEVTEGFPDLIETPVAADRLDLVDTQRIGLQASGRAGPVDLLVTGSFTRAANGFVWDDTQYVDAWRKQVNAGFLGGDAFLSLTAPAADGRLGFKGQINYSSMGAPGSLSWPSTDSAQQRTAFQGQLFYENPQLTPALSLEVRLFYKLTSLAYQDPDAFPPADDVHTLHSLGIDVQQQASFVDFLQLVYGVSALADLAESTMIGRRQRFAGGAFLETPLYIGEMLTVTPVLRYDLYSDFPGSLTWKLAAVLRLSDSLSLKAGGGKSYRAPTLNDLYWPTDLWSEGNPDLIPETGYSGELGLSLKTDQLELNASAFVRYVQNGIEWQDQDPDPDPFAYFGKPVNVGEALFPGAQVDVDFQPVSGLHLSGGYTFLYSLVLEGASTPYTVADDKRAIYSPVHTADAAVRWDNGKTRIGADARFTARQFTNEANTTSLPGYVVVNAEARQRLTPNLAVSLSGKNLLNTIYQTVNDYIMPPLSIWLGVEIGY
jgi:vitamin B12 transporter